MKKIKDHHYAIAAIILLIVYWAAYIFPDRITAFKLIMSGIVLFCSGFSISRYLTLKEK